MAGKARLYDARVSVAHQGTGGYMVLAALWQIEEVVFDDVPLLSFTTARNAFEKEIMAGRLHTVDTIALDYAPYIDSSDPVVFWLQPVWYVKGVYTIDPKREFKPWLNDEGTVVDDGIDRCEIVFDQQ